MSRMLKALKNLEAKNLHVAPRIIKLAGERSRSDSAAVGAGNPPVLRILQASGAASIQIAPAIETRNFDWAPAIVIPPPVAPLTSPAADSVIAPPPPSPLNEPQKL